MLHWRLARVYVCIAEVEEDGQRRVTALRNAETHARECLQGDSQRWEGHTWLAAALGYLALEVGMQEQISLSHELLAESDRALALNPKDDIALSIRGSFFRALGKVGWFKKQLASIFVGRFPMEDLQRPSAPCLRPSYSRLTSCGTVTNLACSTWTWGVPPRRARSLRRQCVFPYASPSIVPVWQRSVRFLEDLNCGVEGH